MFRGLGRNLRRWWGIRWPFWIVAPILAVPQVQLMMMISLVGLLGSFIFAAMMVLGPIYIGVAALLDRYGSPAGRLRTAVGSWMECTLLWACTAFGIAHQGSVGGTMGGTDMPYHEAFLFPLTLLHKALS